jgi:hypothetical protein
MDLRFSRAFAMQVHLGRLFAQCPIFTGKQTLTFSGDPPGG